MTDMQRAEGMDISSFFSDAKYSVTTTPLLMRTPPNQTRQMLGTNLRYLNTDLALRSMVVASTGVGDGKSTVALNLAKADAIVAAGGALKS